MKSIKGKLAFFTAKDINRIAPDLDTSDFQNIIPYYDACEEALLDDGFELWDDDIEFVEEDLVSGKHELRFNIALVKGFKRKGKFVLHSIGISYKHIHNNKMNDLEKLVKAYNNLTPHKTGEHVEQDGIDAKKVLWEVIEKMKNNRVKNIK
ncbi:hypothetical protein [uncultured Mediterranean phage]|nr:hypothetical protein [uncultured Mediterranean phage]